MENGVKTDTHLEVSAKRDRNEQRDPGARDVKGVYVSNQDYELLHVIQEKRGGRKTDGRTNGQLIVKRRSNSFCWATVSHVGTTAYFAHLETQM